MMIWSWGSSYMAALSSPGPQVLPWVLVSYHERMEKIYQLLDAFRGAENAVQGPLHMNEGWDTRFNLVPERRKRAGGH